LAGAIKSQIIMDFPQGLAPQEPLDLTQRMRGHFGSRRVMH
jgi:hypothetical protein